MNFGTFNELENSGKTQKDKVASRKKGRLPDDFYTLDPTKPRDTIHDMRLDVFGLIMVEKFSHEIESLEGQGESNFIDFYENVARDDYFGGFDTIARKLGLDIELSEILSRNQDLFRNAHTIFMKIQNQEPISSTEVQEIARGYRKFLEEVKVLFENFRDTVPEEL